jgi:hypothetical protein
MKGGSEKLALNHEKMELAAVFPGIEGVPPQSEPAPRVLSKKWRANRAQ